VLEKKSTTRAPFLFETTGIASSPSATIRAGSVKRHLEGVLPRQPFHRPHVGAPAARLGQERRPLGGDLKALPDRVWTAGR